jgi:hypothetical protein
VTKPFVPEGEDMESAVDGEGVVRKELVTDEDEEPAVVKKMLGSDEEEEEAQKEAKDEDE